MKPDEIFQVMKEMEMLFCEYTLQYNTIISNGKAVEIQMAAVDELQRAQAKKASDIVVKHCHWPDTLGQQLKRILAYVEAHPERIPTATTGDVVRDANPTAKA